MPDSKMLTAIIHGVGLPLRQIGDVQADSARSYKFAGRLESLRWLILQNLLGSNKGEPPLEGSETEIMFPLEQSMLTSRLFLELHTNFDSGVDGSSMDAGMAAGEIIRALAVFFPTHPVHVVMHHLALDSERKTVTSTRISAPREREYTYGLNCALVTSASGNPCGSKTIVEHGHSICLECGHRKAV